LDVNEDETGGLDVARDMGMTSGLEKAEVEMRQ
jgi:hypothetical protein